MNKKLRLAYLVSHPIQYQAPLLRRIAQEPDIDLTVFFGSDFSVRGYQDKGFGVGVKWDVPLLDGYKHEFLPVLRDNATNSITSPLSHGILSRLKGRNGEAAFDALWVHGYLTINALHGMVAAKALGVPVLLRAESWLGGRRSGSGARLVAKRLFFAVLKGLVDAVLPIGTRNASHWRHYLGDDLPMFLMPYAVDNEYFQRQCKEAAPRRGALQQELGLDPLRPVILFASKLQTRKRCGDLLEAYLRLSVDGGEPHPYLVIVGDGEERVALEKRAAASGLNSIRFCGFRNQSELPRFFDLASVFVLPSQYEQWGLIVNEVMNAGRAVIVSDDVGSQPDLVRDRVEGCVFPVGDVDGLTACLRRTLDRPESAAVMGQRGLERIKQWSFEEDVLGLRQALASVTRKIEA